MELRLDAILPYTYCATNLVISIISMRRSQYLVT